MLFIKHNVTHIYVKCTYVRNVTVQYLELVKNRDINEVSDHHKILQDINIYARSARHCGPHGAIGY